MSLSASHFNDRLLEASHLLLLWWLSVSCGCVLCVQSTWLTGLSGSSRTWMIELALWNRSSAKSLTKSTTESVSCRQSSENVIMTTITHKYKQKNSPFPLCIMACVSLRQFFTCALALTVSFWSIYLIFEETSGSYFTPKPKEKQIMKTSSRILYSLSFFFIFLEWNFTQPFLTVLSVVCKTQ